jgi:hypothetical protein
MSIADGERLRSGYRFAAVEENTNVARSPEDFCHSA